jgi:hypothetical protein
LRAGWLETLESVVEDIFDSGCDGLAMKSDSDGLGRGGSDGGESSDAEEAKSSGAARGCIPI